MRAVIDAVCATSVARDADLVEIPTRRRVTPLDPYPPARNDSDPRPAPEQRVGFQEAIAGG
jgi:hypothetical protein